MLRTKENPKPSILGQEFAEIEAERARLEALSTSGSQDTHFKSLASIQDLHARLDELEKRARAYLGHH